MAAVKKKKAAKSASKKARKKVAKKAAGKVAKKTTTKTAAKKGRKKKAAKKANAGRKSSAAKKTAKKTTRKKAVKKSATKKKAAKKKAAKKKAVKKKTARKTARKAKPVTLPARPAAPTAKPLTEARRSAFRETLEAKQKEIHALYSHDIREGLRTSSDGAEDVVDRANQAYNRELNFALSDGERELLLLIEEAQARLDTPDFGVCLNCSTPIAELRLEAVPWAKYCIDCQEMQERGLLSD